MFQNLLDHVNANGEQMPIASSSMIRSHSVSGDLHGVQLDPVAADILRKELEHETFLYYLAYVRKFCVGGLLLQSMQIHFIASNNDCGVRDFDMEKFQLCKHSRYPWQVNIKHVYQDANSIAEFLASYVVLYGRNSDFSENGKLFTARRVLLGVLGSELFYCLSSVGRRSFVCFAVVLGVIDLPVPHFWSSPLLLVCTVKGLGGVIDVVEVHVLLGVLGSFKRLPWFSISLDAVCDVLLGCWFWGRVFPAGLLFLLCAVLCTVYVTVHVNSLPADADGFSTTLLNCWLLAAASLLDFS
ncbi:unnamed protein product [Ilex paraguariensis]|uniref:Uncharacterized protein n=1 Tax=Ilex paraguariensis TaxID=185542 RepID=A0ABC8TL56_9AQUA